MLYALNHKSFVFDSLRVLRDSLGPLGPREAGFAELFAHLL